MAETKRFGVVIQRTVNVIVDINVRPEWDKDELLERIIEKAYEEEIYSLDFSSTARLAEDYSLEAEEEERICSVCGKPMKEGYCLDGGLEYYCSTACLHRDFTDEEWEEECNTNEDSYWTEW